MYKKLDPGKIRDFCFVSDIEEILPHGFIRFWDTDGKTFSEFGGLAMGSQVNVKISGEGDDEGTEVEFPDMMVGDVKLYEPADTSIWSGDIVIDFVHPWKFMNNMDQHAYEAMNGTELVKKVLIDQARGRPWPLVETDFEKKSDDDGSYSRYKPGDDYHFLLESVLPYCSFNQMPAYMFCRHDGKFRFSSFNQLYKENSKIILGPKNEDFGLKDVGQQIEASMKANGIEASDVYSIESGSAQIGSPEVVREIYPGFIAENANSGGTVTAYKKPGNKLKDNKDSGSFGAYLPISSLMMSQSGGTVSKMISNRSLVDSLICMFASSKVLDYSFRLMVQLPFVGHKVMIGDTVDLVLPKVHYEEGGELKSPGSYVHWLSGRWLVMKTEHTVKTGQQTKLTSNLWLARPSFVGKEKDTSIINVPMLYESR